MLGTIKIMIKFHANIVESFKEKFFDDFCVFSIFFEESDPDTGGESWNFQRALGADGTIESLGEDDDGVCVVKEIQQLTFNEGIKSIEISRYRFICKFDPVGRKSAMVEGLDISYDISEDGWEKLVQMAELVFTGKPYLTIA